MKNICKYEYDWWSDCISVIDGMINDGFFVADAIAQRGRARSGGYLFK